MAVMTNGEKFKTAEERQSHFNKFCNQYVRCHHCPLGHPARFGICKFKWLDLEYKEELKPCPFCDGEAVIERLDVSDCKYRARCSNVKCKIAPRTRWHKSAEEAAEDWNRRGGEAQ